MHPKAAPPAPAHQKPDHATATLSFDRLHQRLNITCPALFSGTLFIAEGTVRNLSQAGCLLECDRAVLQGSYMPLRILLPDHHRSLIVELAAVRWVDGDRMGVEFLRFPQQEQSRLATFLKSLQGR